MHTPPLLSVGRPLPAGPVRSRRSGLPVGDIAGEARLPAVSRSPFRLFVFTIPKGTEHRARRHRSNSIRFLLETAVLRRTATAVDLSHRSFAEAQRSADGERSRSAERRERKRWRKVRTVHAHQRDVSSQRWGIRDKRRCSTLQSRQLLYGMISSSYANWAIPW